MTDFVELTHKVIKKQMNTVGKPITFRIIGKVDGVQLDEDNTIRVTDVNKRTFFELVKEFKESSGDNAVYIIARTVEEEGDPELAEYLRYYVIIDAVIEKAIEVMGEEDALEGAGSVEGLEMEHDHVGYIDGDPKDILKRLVESYKGILGEIVCFLIAEKIRKVKMSTIDLPENIGKYI